MITDNSGAYVYTTLEDAYLPLSDSKWQQAVYVNAIEGTIHDYTVNGSPDISISNLDEDYRLYFDRKSIAENGIFIKSKSDLNYDWEQVDNLVSHPLQSKVFKFGLLPNSDTCYIEFPKDIAELLPGEPVLNIKYIASSGVKGNLKANTMTSFLNDIVWKYNNYAESSNSNVVINDSIRIIQSAPTLNGKDPETLDEAYNNYKRTIGTFDTLITARDYENYIYNIEYNKEPLVSNVVIGDRTSDVNVSNYVKSWNPSCEESNLIVLNNKNGKPQLDAFSVTLYALNNSNVYNETFDPNTDFTIAGIIRDLIDDIKVINHDFINPSEYQTLESTILYLAKNLVSLNGQVLTYSKVSAAEASEIENNIQIALQQQYNSRMLDFGDSLDYDALIKAIQDSDARIKTVVLNVPSYQISKTGVTRSGEAAEYTDKAFFNAYEKLYIVARMILAGKTQLYKFDDSFDYDFGKSDIIINGSDAYINSTIRKISTNLDVDLIPDSAKREYLYTLDPNESIQLYSPNLIADPVYSAYVKYIFTYPIGATAPSIVKDKDYRLKVGEKLQIQYTDSANIIRDKEYHEGTIICPNFDLTAFNTQKFNVMPAGQQIAIKSMNQTILRAGTQFYFALNNNANLDLEANKSYILKENETFIYTNNETNAVIVLGSGTMLTAKYSLNRDYIPIDLNNIESNKNDINWYTLGNNEITITDLNIITVNYGSTIHFSEDIGRFGRLSSEEKILDFVSDDFYFRITDSISGEEQARYYNTRITNQYWRVRTKLNLTSNIDMPQLISTKMNADRTPKQQVTLTLNEKDHNGNYIVVSAAPAGSYLSFNDPVILSGGQDIDVGVLKTDNNIEYSLKSYAYSDSNILADGETFDSKYFTRKNGAISIPVTDGRLVRSDDGTTATYEFKFTFTKGSKWLIPVYVSLVNSNTTVAFYTKSSANMANRIQLPLMNKHTISNIGQESNPLHVFDINSAKSNVILIDSASIAQQNVNYVNLIVEFKSSTVLGTGDSVNIGKISKVLGYNSGEIDVSSLVSKSDGFTITDKVNGESVEDVMINILENSSPNVAFDWSYRVKASDKVIQPTLSSSFFNKNHIYNKYTMPMILFDDVIDSDKHVIVPKSSITVNSFNIL